MDRIVTGLQNFDSKRIKVTLDYDEVTFLLYKGEIKSLGIREGKALDEEAYSRILDDILIPRAKKRVLYFMKNADKTEGEIRRKLREGLYPDEVTEAAMEFLKKYGFADDVRYTEEYVAAKKSRYSRREIEARLLQKGIKRELLSELLPELITAEDEEEAAHNAIRARYSHDVAESEMERAYAYLARHGYSSDAIRSALGGR